MPKRSRSRSRSASPTRTALSKRANHDGHPRAHVQQGLSGQDAGGGNTRSRTVADLFPFQEIFLRVLSFLDPGELASSQRVSKYWARMSVDPQLWKRLYLARYPHPHQSRLLYTSPDGPASTPTSTPRTPRSLRPIARLPSRAFPPPSPHRSPSLPSTPEALTLIPGPSRTPDAHVRLGGTGHATLRSSRGTGVVSSEPVEGDEIGSGVRNDGVDWKLMLRLGTNWSNGNALSQSTIPLPPSPSPSIGTLSLPGPALSSPSSGDRDSDPHPQTHSQPSTTEQHLALSPSFIFVSSPASPLVQVHPSSNSGTTPLGIIPPPPGWSSPHRPDNVTCIVSDQSVVPFDDPNTTSASPTDIPNVGSGAGAALPARLVVFYQSGGFVLLSISQSSTMGINWNRESVHPPHTRPQSVRRRATVHTSLEGDPIVLAALHFPVLLSCTRDFHLSVYSFARSREEAPAAAATTPPRHLKTMHSEVSFHPAALSLFPNPTNGDSVSTLTSTWNGLSEFKAALTYCTPIYPSSWTVAVQELTISLASGLSPTPTSALALSPDEVSRGECFTLASEADEPELVWPRKVRPLVGVKGKAMGIGSDGRWCVLAGEGSQIQVYSLPHRSSDGYEEDVPDTRVVHPFPDTSTEMWIEAEPTARLEERHLHDDSQRIIHSQTLLAHSTEVTSLALSSGRCVSGGRDGRVLVWELDNPTGRGRTVGYVEVRPGGRRPGGVWRGAAGPLARSELSADGPSEEEEAEARIDRSEGKLPHPQSISSAARSLFLPAPPKMSSSHKPKHDDTQPAIRHLVFDEEKIVGLIGCDDDKPAARGSDAGTMKVWNFSG